MPLTKLQELLLEHEGVKLKPYLDTAKPPKLTIGVGRNLDDTGISHEEALVLLDNDILRARVLASHFPWFVELSEVRQDVVVCMLFNMGPGPFKKFTQMIAALAAHDYERAASEMKSSVWASQVGKRAVTLSDMMSTDAYQS